MAEVDLDNLSTSDLLEIGLHCHIESAIDVLVSASEKQARVIRPIVADLPTAASLGVYWNPAVEKVGMYFHSSYDPEVFGLYKEAVAEHTGLSVAERPLTRAHLADWWVKVAHSPTLRAIAEGLQFVPSETIPGFGGRPIASMVATGLLGAGLGYGGGWLAEKLIPDKYKEKGRLARSLAMMGGLGGAALGSIPGLVNLYAGRSFNAPSVISGPTYEQLRRKPPLPYSFKNIPDDAPISHTMLPPQSSNKGFEGVPDANAFNPLSSEHRIETPHMPELGSKYLQAAANVAATGAVTLPDEILEDLENLEKAATGTLGYSPVELIRTDELGRVLWGSDANPTTTIMTASALHGASQMPDPRALPGTVTPHQTGLLGMAMGAAGGGLQGYVMGYGVGKAMSLLTGLPEESQKFVAQTGLGLGVLNAVVPRLFGR